MIGLMQQENVLSKTKTEIIYTLKNVKLIIGNGFDLHCNLKTKYSDYFSSNQSKNEILKKWVLEFYTNIDTYSNFKKEIANKSDMWVGFNDFEATNVWDIVFFLASYENEEFKEWKWCDIELKMLEWLQDYHKNKTIYFCFPMIYRMLNGEEPFESIDWRAKYLASFIYKKHREIKFSDQTDFYSFLLQQLKLFEKNFGEYIYHQQYNDNAKSFGLIQLNINYVEYAKETIAKLCNPNNIVSIDSFNFGTTCINRFKDITNNINGDINRPIFGIDSNAFFVPDPRYIFTKTNRRIELNALNPELSFTNKFENVIIFGSSLGQADYSYFFSIFDKMNIVNINDPSKIVFAFSIYDKANEDSLKTHFFKQIFQLFQEYSKYKGSENHPNRLLDSLIIQEKVILFQID